MLSALLSIDFNPGIRGILVVLVMFVFLIGGTYLLVGSNLGARLGFLVVAAALAGWMMCMSLVWVIYGIGLKGPEPTWKPAAPVTIIRDGAQLNVANVVDAPIEIKGLAPEAAAKKAQEHGVKKVDVFVKGPGSGRETAIRSLQAAGLEVGAISDVTPLAHNGCRPPKPRRV